MKITRGRTLALLAVVAGVAGLTQLVHPPEEEVEPDGFPATSAGTARPHAAAAADSTAQAGVQASGAQADALPEPPPPRRAAASPRGAVLSVGSEGYGPHIDRAQAGDDAATAWEAVRWMRLCASNEQRRDSFEKLRGRGVSPELMTQLMIEADAEARRCQTVTPYHRALLPELAARAMRAGVPEAASAYAGAVFPGDLTPVERQEVADAMRRDARAGDPQSLLGATLSNEAWGLSDAERMAFLQAYGELAGPNGKAVVKNLLDQHMVRFKTPPTAAQWAAAETSGALIAAEARAQH